MNSAPVKTTTSTAVDLGNVEDVLSGDRAVIRLPGSDLDVLVFRNRRGVHAVENRCPHTGRTLCDARLRGRRLTCRGHAGTFDIDTGKPSAGTSARLTSRPLRSFRVWTIDGRLFLAT